MKTLKFTRPHRHAGIRYAEGQVATFDDRAAAQIIAAKSAEITGERVGDSDGLPAPNENEASPRAAGKASPK